MLFGRALFTELNNSNADWSIVFYIFYSIIFYFIILNVYAAIVMRTYDNLRIKKQLVQEAMADIFAKQAQEHTNKVRNIIFCRMDRVQIVDSDEESGKSEDEVEEDTKYSHEENKRRLKIADAALRKVNIEDEAGMKHTPSLHKRIMSNIGVLQELLNPNSN